MSEPLSCLPGQPLVSFGSGNAPTLDYNLPQKSVMSFWHAIEFDDIELMNPSRFKASFADVPEDDWWEFTERLSASQLKSLIIQELETGVPVTNNAGNTFWLLEGFRENIDNNSAKGAIFLVDSKATGHGGYYLVNGAFVKSISYTGFSRVSATVQGGHTPVGFGTCSGCKYRDNGPIESNRKNRVSYHGKPK